MADIERGRIRILFRTGSYDGMVTGVGILDGQHVFLNAREQQGGWDIKPRWRELEDLLEELLTEEDAENIWDRIERGYENEMNQDLPRRFKVQVLTDEQFERIVERHRNFQLHVGLHCDFFYDKEGRPRHAPRGDPDETYWSNSTEYHKAHFYDPFLPRRVELNSNEMPVLGYINRDGLYAPSSHRPAFPEDPRSAELRHYQQTWKPGDAVRLDW
jgi:hypothetical protein